MGFESTHRMETKELCGAARPSKSLKKTLESSVSPNCPKKAAWNSEESVPTRNSIRARLATSQF